MKVPMKNEGSDEHGRSMNRSKSSLHGYSSTRYEKNNEYSRPTCSRCGKKHEGRSLAGRDGCYGCGESVHMMRD